MSGRDDHWFPLIISASVGVVVFMAAALYTYSATPEYTASATVKLPSDNEQGGLCGGSSLFPIEVLFESKERLAVLRERSELAKLDQSVAERIGRDPSFGAFQAPYPPSSVSTVTEILSENLGIQVSDDGDLLHFHYTHANPKVAATIANYYADELLNYYVKLKIEVLVRAVEDLRIRTAHQREKVEAVKQKLKEANAQAAERLKDDLEVQQAIYEAMMNRLQAEMMRIGPCVSPDPSVPRILDFARPPLAPSKPNVLQNLLLGAAPLPLLLVVGLLWSRRR